METKEASSEEIEKNLQYLALSLWYKMRVILI